MRLYVDRLAYAITSFLLLASVANGGILSGDGAAIMKGSIDITSVIGINGDIGTKLSASIEYAVYAPGTFGSSLALGSPGNAAEPSNGTEYVYAYEIINNALSVAISSFSVGIFDQYDPITSLANKGVMTSAGGVTPFKVEFIPNPAANLGDITNAKYSFGPPNTTIPVGGHSDYLMFTSPLGPGLKTSSVVGTGSLRNRLLPTPIPEPSTILLGSFGVATLLAIAGYRRRRKV
jgi:PEP-CTERM motif